MGLKAQSSELDRLQREIYQKLESNEEPVTIDYLIDNTSANDRGEIKDALQEMINKKLLKTSPGFEYKLASHVSSPA